MNMTENCLVKLQTRNIPYRCKGSFHGSPRGSSSRSGVSPIQPPSFPPSSVHPGLPRPTGFMPPPSGTNMHSYYWSDKQLGHFRLLGEIIIRMIQIEYNKCCLKVHIGEK